MRPSSGFGDGLAGGADSGSGRGGATGVAMADPCLGTGLIAFGTDVCGAGVDAISLGADALGRSIAVASG